MEHDTVPDKTAIPPLVGLRVVDFTRLLPGAACSLVLADWGAEVIKVEEPERGDYWRWEEPRLGPYGARFSALNRSKRSVALDLKTAAGREAAVRLAATADVVLEGFRPGVAKRLGIGWEALAEVNPRLIYCSISGYGQKGPLRDKAGHDLNYLGLAGMLELSGPADGPPVNPGPPIGDLGGGSWPAISAICLALYQRNLTGRGQAIDISIHDGLMYWMATAALEAIAQGHAPRRGVDPILGGAAWYRCYETSDGRAMVVAAYEKKFWARFCTIIGLPDFIASQHEGADQQRHMANTIADVFRSRTFDEWRAVFDGEDCCVTPSLTVLEALSSAHVQARGAVTSVAGVTVIRQPVQGTSITNAEPTSPPHLGQNDELVQSGGAAASAL
jgi:crotonobetainyl-CoA:carnitine CoA-transferase CaiB-like acyl-CoA transferase